MKTTGRILAVLIAAVGVLVVAGITLSPRGNAPGEGDVVGSFTSGAATAQGVDAAAIAELEARVERLPGDWTAWASLANARIEVARVTGDPSQYPLAEAAIAQSFEVQPEDNLLAHVAASRLAAARHDFDLALTQGEMAVAVSPENAEARLAVADALVEQGDYDAAADEVQAALDRRPGLSALARASYLREISGNVDGAVLAMEQAAALAGTPADRAFTAFHLGQLAFDRGDLDEAEARFDEAGGNDPGWVAPVAGLARVTVARGDLDVGLEAWDDVLARLPLPEYLSAAIDAAVAAGDEDRAADYTAVLDAQEILLADAGVSVDLEIALAEADRGVNPKRAVAAAEAEWDRRHSIHVADALGWALLAAGRADEAISYADQAVAQGSRFASFHFHRGMILADLGRDTEAAEALSLALEINPHFSPRWAPIAEQTLADLER